MLKKILLASGSPRRKELLTLAGLSFEIKVPEIDETPLPHEKPVQMVKRLSLEKGTEVWRNFLNQTDSALILAADTTVVNAEGDILGKPKDNKEAIHMITSLQGKTHRVYTGYSILEVVTGELCQKLSHSVETKVAIRVLTANEIRNYVARGESLDKAGGYAAQGYGMAIIDKIDGSFSNVVGLPLAEVMEDLKKFGWHA